MEIAKWEDRFARSGLRSSLWVAASSNAELVRSQWTHIADSRRYAYFTALTCS